MKQPDYLHAIKAAFEQGYRVDLEAGTIIGKKGEPLKLNFSAGSVYPKVTLVVSGCNRPKYTIKAHKIVAFAIFGEAAFAPGVHVRHLDDNKLNLKGSNFALGTKSENERDKPIEVRRASARKAQAARPRRFTEEAIDAMRRLCREPGDQALISRLTGVDQSSVSKIVRGASYATSP
jgi:hypothetical protein